MVPAGVQEGRQKGMTNILRYGWGVLIALGLLSAGCVFKKRVCILTDGTMVLASRQGVWHLAAAGQPLGKIDEMGLYAAIAPSRRFIVYVRQRQARSYEQLAALVPDEAPGFREQHPEATSFPPVSEVVVLDTSDFTPRVVHRQLGEIMFPVFAPRNERYLTWYDGRGPVALFDMSSGQVHYPLGRGEGWALTSWSPDGQMLAAIEKWQEPHDDLPALSRLKLVRVVDDSGSLLEEPLERPAALLATTFTCPPLFLAPDQVLFAANEFMLPMARAEKATGRVFNLVPSSGEIVVVTDCPLVAEAVAALIPSPRHDLLMVLATVPRTGTTGLFIVNTAGTRVAQLDGLLPVPPAWVDDRSFVVALGGQQPRFVVMRLESNNALVITRNLSANWTEDMLK